MSLCCAVASYRRSFVSLCCSFTEKFYVFVFFYDFCHSNCTELSGLQQQQALCRTFFPSLLFSLLGVLGVCMKAVAAGDGTL